MNIAEENHAKYLVPPTIPQILAYFEKIRLKKGSSTKLNQAGLERYFAMPKGMLTEVFSGRRNLPRKYWHYIFEQVVPEFGLGYVKISDSNRFSTSKKSSRIVENTPLKQQEVEITDFSHPSLSTIQEQKKEA